MSRFKPYPRYKDSRVLRFGKIPEHWRTAKMKELGQFASSGIDKKEQEGETHVRMVNYTDVYGNRTRAITKDRELMSTTCPHWKVKACSLQRGDLVFTPSSETEDDIGLSALVTDDLPNTVFSYHVLRFRFKEELDINFRKYLANNPAVLDFFSSVCEGTTRQILTRDDFKNALVLLPDTEEQRAIAEFLDRETANIDNLIAKKERLLELLEEKRAALITHAVTSGLNPDTPLRDSGIEWLGQIPKHWEVKRLRHVSPHLNVGIVVNPSSYISTEGVPFLYGSEIKEGRIDADRARKIPADVSRRLRDSCLHADDLVMVRVGAPGVTAVVPSKLEGANCASILVIRRNPAVNSQWLCYALNSRVVRYQVEVVQYGAAQEQFNVRHAVDFRVPMPKRDEQDSIATTLTDHEATIDSLKSRVSTAVERLKEYRAALITAAVTGKIDVREGSQAPQSSQEELSATLSA
jgi:type I restriction enzyme S subunit